MEQCVVMLLTARGCLWHSNVWGHDWMYRVYPF
jgi:hypothetical protein